MNWAEEIYLKYEIKPTRPLRKIPMQNTVLDSEYNIFVYDFYNNKIRYTYMGSVCKSEE